MFSSTLKRSVATVGVVAGLLAAAAPAGAAAPAVPNPGQAPGGPTTVTTTAPATTNGIIMRDGGICDPIRHMGC
jgi:hypothetical protein